MRTSSPPSSHSPPASVVLLSSSFPFICSAADPASRDLKTCLPTSFESVSGHGIHGAGLPSVSVVSISVIPIVSFFIVRVHLASNRANASASADDGSLETATKQCSQSGAAGSADQSSAARADAAVRPVICVAVALIVTVSRAGRSDRCSRHHAAIRYRTCLAAPLPETDS